MNLLSLVLFSLSIVNASSASVQEIEENCLQVNQILEEIISEAIMKIESTQNFITEVNTEANTEANIDANNDEIIDKKDINLVDAKEKIKYEISEINEVVIKSSSELSECKARIKSEGALMKKPSESPRNQLVMMATNIFIIIISLILAFVVKH